MPNGGKAQKKRRKKKARAKGSKGGSKIEGRKRASSTVDAPWEDSGTTSSLWQYIKMDDVESIESWLDVDPNVVNVRSADGRGPLWWAHEFGREHIVELLLENGADPEQEDKDGVKPADLVKKEK